MAGSALGGMATQVATPMAAGAPSGGGKGGASATLPMPTTPAPTQGQYAPLTPQGGFNVNQAAAAGLQQAMQGTQAGMGYRPQAVMPVGFQAAQMGPAGQVASTDLGAYTNPYESQVVQQSLADLERSRLMQQNKLGAQATAAGAFGGSRQGIAEAETNRAFAEQAARTASGLRQAGFTQAQQLAGQDIGRQMQVSAANQAALNQARQFGAQQGMTAQQLNQMAATQANQARLSASAQLGQLGQQAFQAGRTITQDQMKQGLMQQGLQQALIDAARGQFAGYAGAPQAALSAPLAALGAAPVPQSRTSSSSPGLFDYLSLGAGIAAASDPRLKENVKPVGKFGGVNFYRWDWNEEGKRIADAEQPTLGVMADELQETHPHLVQIGPDGFLRVDYKGLAAEMA